MKRLDSVPFVSPIGPLDIFLDGDTLVYLDFAGNRERAQQLLTPRFGPFEIRYSGRSTAIHDDLATYFAEGKSSFDMIALETGGTPFQRRVWQALRKIPLGTTIDYSTLAAQVGNSRAIRAAASSNARNPIAIVIPCHRVIGKDGSLRGYSGGYDRKRWLIQHERRCWQSGK